MNNEDEIKKRILSKAEEMFNTFGWSKVTMEEIALNLGISKKTLYKHFSNKEHILKEIIYTNKCNIDAFVDDLLNNKSLDFIVKLKKFMTFIANQSSKMDSPFIADVMKNYPEIWNDIKEFRGKRAHKNLSVLIQQGVKSGIFRKDIHTEVLVLGYVGAIHNLISPDVISNLPISRDQIFKEVMKILFEGIFTTEGRRKYKSSKKLNDTYGETL